MTGGFPDNLIIAVVFDHEPSRICENEVGLLCTLHLAENDCTPESQGANFDLDDLSGNPVSEEARIAFKAMYTHET